MVFDSVTSFGAKLNHTIGMCILCVFTCYLWSACSIDEELLIERSIHKGMINPGEEKQTVEHKTSVTSMQYTVRVRCHEHYYGSKCNQVCRPRDDYFGHYVCDQSGNRNCMEGWTGPDCKTGEGEISAQILSNTCFGSVSVSTKNVDWKLCAQHHKEKRKSCFITCLNVTAHNYNITTTRQHLHKNLAINHSLPLKECFLHTSCQKYSHIGSVNDYRCHLCNGKHPCVR